MNGRSPTNQPVFRGIRSSKFKHVYSCPAKKELCYDNIAITKNAHDSQFCAVNPKFVAIVTESAGGGTFIVIPIHETGRLDINEHRVSGHRGPVLDLKWNPFNDNVIASSSDDCSVMLWYIPDEGPSSRGITQPIMTLLEHKRRVSMIEWHPTAENILISTGADHLILVWNTCKGRVVRVINCHTDTIQSISLNRDGSLLATTCKDKILRIIDVRKQAVVKSGVCHEGPKSAKVSFLGDSGRLFTTGFSKFSDRQWAVWSQNDLASPLRLENIDSSSGILFPFYDHDTQMVYVAGKGDGSIRYYEVTDSSPWCFYINQLITGFPQRGMGIMPKRGLDPEKCEVFRFYKLHATRPLCEPISMIVPRKSTLFQNDLYPDTSAPSPAMTADEWLSGKNRPPIVMSMKTGAIVTKTNKSQAFVEDIGLINTGDPNIDRKFIFLSKENRVDYRPKKPQQENRESIRLMKSTSVGNLNGSQFNRVKKFPWNSEGHEPVTVYEVVKDRVETRQFPRKSFFPIDIDSQLQVQPVQKHPSPVRHKSRASESEDSELNFEADNGNADVQSISPPRQKQQIFQQLQQPIQQQKIAQLPSTPQQDNASVQMHNLLKLNQEEINYLKEQIKVKDAKICELEAIVKQLTLRN